MMNIGYNGNWAQIIPYIGFGGAWVKVTGYWIGYNGAWKSMAILPMVVSASSSTVNGSGTYPNPNNRPNITIGSVTVSVAGGSGTFAYSWTVVFNAGNSIDNTGTCSANSPTSSVTTFTGQSCNGSVSPGSDYYTATCTVTDTVTGQVGSVVVQITLTNTYVNPN